MRRTVVVSVLVPVAVLALTVLAWHLYVTLGDVETFALPAPELVVKTLWNDWDTLGPALWVTLKLTFSALALAVIGGVALAVLMSQSRWIELAQLTRERWQSAGNPSSWRSGATLSLSSSAIFG